MTDIQRHRPPQRVDARPVEPARARIHWRVRGSACSIVGRDLAEISRTIQLLEEQGFTVEADRPVRWGHDGELVLVDCSVHRPAPPPAPVPAARAAVGRGWWWIPATLCSVGALAAGLALLLNALLPYALVGLGVVVALAVGAALLGGGDRISIIQKVTIRK